MFNPAIFPCSFPTVQSPRTVLSTSTTSPAAYTLDIFVLKYLSTIIPLLNSNSVSLTKSKLGLIPEEIKILSVSKVLPPETFSPDTLLFPKISSAAEFKYILKPNFSNFFDNLFDDSSSNCLGSRYGANSTIFTSLFNCLTAQAASRPKSTPPIIVIFLQFKRYSCISFKSFILLKANTPFLKLPAIEGTKGLLPVDNKSFLYSINTPSSNFIKLLLKSTSSTILPNITLIFFSLYQSFLLTKRSSSLKSLHMYSVNFTL